MAGPEDLVIAGASWDTSLSTSEPNNPESKPKCVTNKSIVECFNIQTIIEKDTLVQFWLKFAFSEMTDINASVKFFDPEDHAIAAFTMDAQKPIWNNDA